MNAGGMVVRPGLVHGRAGSALLDGMHDAARQDGVVRYVGDGSNRWSLVHADDLAELVRLALERPQPGAILNAASDEAPMMGEIAETVAAVHGVAAAPLDVERAREAMGDFADQLTRDLVVDSRLARETLRWQPSRSFLHEVLAPAA